MTKLKSIIKISFIFIILTLISGLQAGSRNPVRGKNGMVVTSHELASQVGIEILKKGGNAVDAAVAVGFALAVVHPTAGNIGGGGFMVIRFPDGNSTTIDFREKAPLKAHRYMYLDESGEIIEDLNMKGYLASGVPGSVVGLTTALEKYGTQKLKKVIAPAIKLAKNGFPVSYNFFNDLVRLKDVFLEFPASAEKFLKDNNEPYEEGQIFKQPDLAKTLKLIASKGADAFYKGKIADLIAEDMAKNGGLITKEDLALYQAIERQPVRGSYRGYELISMAPPSSGGIAVIQTLNILEDFDLKQLGFNSSQYIHLLAETFKQVYCDRAKYLGDNDFVDVPIQMLIDKKYADSLRLHISQSTATPADQISPGQPPIYEGNHTTHYSIIDKDKMTVAVTTTINSGYGSKVVIAGAGFLMNNEMDDFAAKPGAPNYYGLVSYDVNAIEPEKRMLSSMSPTIIAKDGKVFMTVGAMGGARIITSVIQAILNVIDFKMTVQEAIDAPRIHHQWLPDKIKAEKFALSIDVIKNLTLLGYELAEGKYYFSEAHAIVVDAEEGVYLGAADSRFEGNAVGY